MKKQMLVLLGVILSLWACESLVPVVPIEPDPTPIVELKILTFPLEKVIKKGETMEIGWITNGNVIFNGEKVSSNFMVVKPEVTTTYYITASIGSVVKSDSVIIEVIQPDPYIVEMINRFRKNDWQLRKIESQSLSNGEWSSYELHKSDSTDIWKFYPPDYFERINEEGVVIGRDSCKITQKNLWIGDEMVGYQFTDSTLITTRVTEDLKDLTVRTYVPFEK